MERPVSAGQGHAPPPSAPAGATEVRTLEAELDHPRVAQLAGALGCSPDLDAISRTLLQHTALNEDARHAVCTTVEHLLNHDRAWRAMVSGVVPPSLRAQALAVTVRTSPTDPADSVPALVLAAVREAVSAPDLSHATSRLAERPAHPRQIRWSILLATITVRFFRGGRARSGQPSAPAPDLIEVAEA